MLSVETKGRIVDELLAIERQIDDMEATVPHDQLPSLYDELIRRRDSAKWLLDIGLEVRLPAAKER